MPAVGAVPAVYFLSDYGLADEFVGVVHAVLHTAAPTVPVIDLSHELPPFDVGAGAAMLVRCAPYLGAGVVLAVVDPGVGTVRRGVAIQPAGGGPSWLVGPDNGLLAPLAAALGGVGRVLALDPPRPSTAGRPAGRTFDGRDLFAPAVAHLVTGGSPADLGPEVEPATLVAAPGASPLDPAARHRQHATDAELETVVTWIDRFGNIQLEAGAEALAGTGVVRGGRVQVSLRRAPPRSETARWVTAFGDLKADELGLLVDSAGNLALVRFRSSAVDHFGPLSVGDAVRLGPDPAVGSAG